MLTALGLSVRNSILVCFCLCLFAWSATGRHSLWFLPTLFALLPPLRSSHRALLFCSGISIAAQLSGSWSIASTG
ncbi:hypothetical protein BZA70DRAFT_156619 [Myxozyma melibiosi]|uniref:Secreted peptide n=1 Tax=Myxozyma melibiosi TaxID=54550 RepID=A0ABR1F8F8_9ASCO